MEPSLPVFEEWVRENNETVFRCQEAELVTGAHGAASHLRLCSSAFHKLLRKIQGVAADAAHTHLELTVVYNACLCSAAQFELLEAQQILLQAADRLLQSEGVSAQSSDICVQWKLLLRSTGNSPLKLTVLHLLCLQWTLWLSTHQLERIQTLQEVLSSVRETLQTGVEDPEGNTWKGRCSNARPQLVMEPRRLVDLLHICTIITQSAEKMSEGRSSEALCALQEASALPAPRALLAHTHLLSGCCLAHMSRPQMALHCYKKALETDAGCACALSRSAQLFRELGNAHAEIQALHLLHSILTLPSGTTSILNDRHLLSPALLLNSQSVSSFLCVPSALSILYSLALKSVIHGRVSEGVEHFLDLLAVLHSNEPQELQMCAESSTLPRLPELYLQAAAALLMAQRLADCEALCSEVLSTMPELLPQGFVLEEPDERQEAETDGGCMQLRELLWVGAAHVLQGHCRAHLKDWKQAQTHYTRCVNLLMKVRVKEKGLQPRIPSAAGDGRGKDVGILQKLKGLSLCRRGVALAQTDHLKQALRDLQLGLQLYTEGTGARLWCCDVLWRLNRKHEAAACWQRSDGSSIHTLDQNLPLYLQEPRTGPWVNSAELHHRLQQLNLAGSP